MILWGIERVIIITIIVLFNVRLRLIVGIVETAYFDEPDEVESEVNQVLVGLSEQGKRASSGYFVEDREPSSPAS